MIKKFLLSILAALLCTACAGVAIPFGAQDKESGQARVENPAAAAPDFGSMGRFIGKKFVAHTAVVSISTNDNGNTLVIGNFSFRYTPAGQLQASMAGLENLKASIGPDGSLNVQGENWDNVFKYKFQPNEYGGFTENIDRKSLAGINFLKSFDFEARNDYMPYTEANVRSEAASKAYRDREAAQNAIDARTARRESDQALAHAFNANLSSIAASTAQQAQVNAQRDAMLANINAQAEAQRQAQALQAQRQAAEQQRQKREESARWIAEKEQAAAQNQQALASAQAERAAQRAQQQRDKQQRKSQAQVETREREQQREHQAQADAQLRIQDQQREARAQAQQRVYEQQRIAATQKAEQQARRTDKVAGATPAAPAVGIDLNCLTEGVCRKACPRDSQKPSILKDCLDACTRRSSCKVSYQ